MNRQNNIPIHNDSTKNKHNMQFYTRLVNNTDITLTEPETKLLEKGLKYNLHYKNKHWINRLTLEAVAAVNLIDPLQQNYIRNLIAAHIQKLKKKYTMQNYNNYNTVQEWKIIKGLQEKKNNNLTVTRADKGRTVVIMHKNEYEAKIGDFISNNEFTETNVDPTKQFQKP
jgi:hypothetical protein